MTKRFPASDEFIVWAQSLSGMLTRIRTEYGGVDQMLEHPDWDEDKTPYVVQLVKSLHEHLGEIPLGLH
jgi:hypothetical protein